ncbi:MAG TPA: ATP-dependent RecD-like DNA helicase [Firmicutes bacterium]|nr:ATP-dependent RecD-like DNA helicase [Bacillota bacterium]
MEKTRYIKGIFQDQIYHNDDNGFSIATILLLDYEEDKSQIQKALKSVDDKAVKQIEVDPSKIHGKITVSGYFPRLTSNQTYKFFGQLTEHKKFGWQYVVSSYESVQVEGKSAIVAYLSSDLFEGVGVKTAEKIVEVLGEQAVSLIMGDRSVLDTVPKLSKKIADQLYETLISQQGMEQILAPLYGLNLSPRLVMKIFKKYQYEALDFIQENPYRLIDDIEGIGFVKADEIAKSLGIELNDPRRIRAALLYVIDQIAIQRGHTYVYHQQLIQSTLQYLNANTSILLDLHQVDLQIQELIQKKRIYIEGEYLFIPLLVNSEKGITDSILRLQGHEVAQDSHVLEAFTKLKGDLNIVYSKEQEEAIRMALKHPVSIITGGPGTGKTTVVQGILKAYGLLHDVELDPAKYVTEKEKYPIALAAPTGRAAKRMHETTGIKASTIHKLLGYGADGVFTHDQFDQLEFKLIIIDESSMLDTLLAHQLFQSIQTGAQLILVGDDNQLPSVGPGQVLKDLLESQAIPLTRLLTVHRQAEDSSIISLAHAVKNNHLPTDIREKKSDRLYVECGFSDISKYLIQIIQNAINKGYSASDVQVLAPMYKGECGIDKLNLLLQEVFNPFSEEKRQLEFGHRTYRIGDKVLQLSNQPETGIMNGDVGEVIGISYKDKSKEKEDEVVVCFDQTEVVYKKSDLQNLTHAYCVSVHKSQGSEYPIVILPITNAYHIMLQKKLIYTAITRAKKSLIIIGELSALEKGVKNEGDERQTTLKERFMLLKEPKDVVQNPFADIFEAYEIPFDGIDEEALIGVTPYDFMD